MVVSQCPICKQHLVGYTWTQTQKGKNWLKHTKDGWHDCPKKKFQKKTASKNKKLFGPGITFDYELDSEFKTDNNHGYYCTLGHYLGPTLPKDDICQMCGKTTTAMWFK